MRALIVPALFFLVAVAVTAILANLDPVQPYQFIPIVYGIDV